MNSHELIALRKAIGLKQFEMAEKIGISAAHLCRLEKGTHFPGRLLTMRLNDIRGRYKHRLAAQNN